MSCGRHEHSHLAAGITLLTLASVAITIPFIFYAKDIATSVRTIAGRRNKEESCL